MGERVDRWLPSARRGSERDFGVATIATRRHLEIDEAVMHWARYSGIVVDRARQASLVELAAQLRAGHRDGADLW